jgi:uncharacterized protein involved in exopolysaccharide biosynthesis
MDLDYYGKLFLRRLPYLLVLLALGSALGLTLARVLPPVYRAEAILVVESQQIPDELAASTVNVAMTEQLQIIEQRILARQGLIEMANRLQIYAAAEAEGQRLSADDLVSDMRRRTVIATSGGGNPQRGAVQATIVRVSFEAATASLSAAVTNEIVTRILAENVAIRTNVANQTLRFFEDEVARLDQELTDRGATILAFQEANLNALPDSLDFRRSQQAAAQERLAQVEREAALLRDRRAQLVAVFETTGVVTQTPVAEQSQAARQLAAAQEELAAVLSVLSPQNPRVRVLQAQVDALAAQVAAEAQAASQTTATTDPADPAPADPALMAYELQLADIDSQLDFLADQKTQIEATMADLRASIEATPGNAITLETMQRDYDNIRVQYDQAVANRARAQTGDIIEALAKGQRITVIEQAVPPRRPDRPNRILIAAGGVAGGLVAGLALIVLMELLNTAIRRPADLQKKLDITAFATLPLIRTPRDIWRRRAILAGTFVTIFVGVPLGLWFVHTEVMPVDQLINQAVDRLGLGGVIPRLSI